MTQNSSTQHTIDRYVHIKDSQLAMTCGGCAHFRHSYARGDGYCTLKLIYEHEFIPGLVYQRRSVDELACPDVAVRPSGQQGTHKIA